MGLTKGLTILLIIILGAEGKVKIGIIFDDRIVKSHKLSDYLAKEEIEPVFVSSANIQQSNVPHKLKDVMCIVCISRNKDINDKTSKLGEMLQIPVITSSPNAAPNGKFTVSMYPDYELANRVMVDSLKYWKINPVALLYDIKRSEQAANLQSLARESNIRMFLMPELKMEEEKSLSYAAGELKRSHLTAVVLLCDPRNITTVMDHTIEFNLYDVVDVQKDEDLNEDPKEWKWFALDMDFEPKPDCTPTLHGFVGFVTKIPDRQEVKRIEEFKGEILETGQKIHTQALSNNYYANLHDMFMVLVRWISTKHDHDRERLTVKTLREVRIPACNGNVSKKECTLSGEVKFGANGTRKVNDMKIVDIKKGNTELNYVGEWTPNLKTRSAVTQMTWVKCDGRQKCKSRKTTNRKMYRILVKTDDEPFVIIGKNESLPVEKRFTGFCIDIVRELAKPEYMNFNYTIAIQTHGTGSVNEKTGRWSGIIGELIDQKAEMGTGSLTITAQREKAVDFSKPFMDFKMALILRKPVEEELNMFRFLDPFSPIVWLCTVMAVFAMTIFMYIVDYLSPYGNRKTAKEADEPGDEFSLYNSLWFATASMLQQGPDNTPKSPSGRLLAASFWFFVLLMISTYTANLAAFFTNKKPKNAISNLEDLSKQSKIKYGVLKGGQIHNFLRRSNDTVYKKMVTDMTRFNSFANGASKGVKKARKGGFAYITEEPILEYYNSRSPCNTMLVKQLLEAKSYGFALAKNSELTNKLSVNILKLREKKFMDERYTYWWKARSECSTTVKPIGLDSMKIQFNSMAGVFFILVSGVIISLILVVVEVKFKWVIDLILEAGCEQCTDYNCDDDESYEYMEPAVEATTPCPLKRVPDVYSNVQESKV
ncbi:glutamate receptor 2-like isoform X1 [Paramuricea clavata]|uniref:Glutamate receptor 2-like isoform X1 n=1 Tax=Paramuricea clavata TaxID=317549 RepID=A0A7D9DIK6_PARCT|nr:glutamate receptor 2-like isoform X1 [Paramuricea clavata]